MACPCPAPACPAMQDTCPKTPRQETARRLPGDPKLRGLNPNQHSSISDRSDAGLVLRGLSPKITSSTRAQQSDGEHLCASVRHAPCSANFGPVQPRYAAVGETFRTPLPVRGVRDRRRSRTSQGRRSVIPGERGSGAGVLGALVVVGLDFGSAGLRVGRDPVAVEAERDALREVHRCYGW